VCIYIYSNGCATSEDMLWKLDALQSFIIELHWPDDVFAEHLTHRLKLMSADMIEAAAKRWVHIVSEHISNLITSYLFTISASVHVLV